MKNILFVFLLFGGQLALAQNSAFTISGKIEGLETGFMRMITHDESLPNGYRTDSIIVKDGKFKFSGTTEKFTYVTISPGVEGVMKRTKTGYIPAKSSLIQLFIFPGAKISVSGKITDFVDAYPSGDKDNKAFAELCRVINPLINKSTNISITLYDGVIRDSLQIIAAKNTRGDLDKQVNSYKTSFLVEHPDSRAACWLLSDMMTRSQIPIDSASMIFSSFDRKKLAEVPYYQMVAKRLDGYTNTAIGKKVPDIVTDNTPDGSRFELSSLRGKYLVIDFWGTWCSPCIKGMPKMKEYRDKYSGKLEILGVAQESDDGTRWKKFLQKNPGYNWPQVLNGKKEDYVLAYNVTGFPTKVVVDKDGIIIARFVGEDEEIYKKLDSLFR